MQYLSWKQRTCICHYKKHGCVYPWIMNVTLFYLLKLKPSQSTGEMCNWKVRKSSCWTDLWARPDQVQLSFFRPGLSNLGISGISGGGWVDLATQSAWGQVALTIVLRFSVKPHKRSRFLVVGQEDLPRCLILPPSQNITIFWLFKVKHLHLWPIISQKINTFK